MLCVSNPCSRCLWRRKSCLARPGWNVYSSSAAAAGKTPPASETHTNQWAKGAIIGNLVLKKLHLKIQDYNQCVYTVCAFIKPFNILHLYSYYLLSHVQRCGQNMLLYYLSSFYICLISWQNCQHVTLRSLDSVEWRSGPNFTLHKKEFSVHK